MSETPSETRHTQLLLTNLVIIVIVILGLVFAIIAYRTLLAPEQIPSTQIVSPLPSLTPTNSPTITSSPTVTRTPRPTLTPSITPTPSETPLPTITPTPPGPPTLTPAQPVIGDPYELLPWTAELADNMIALMNDYPNTLPEESRGENNENYFQAYACAIDARQESLLRFPEASQAPAWQWGLAYNLAQTGNPAAAEYYAEIITQGLNRGETIPRELSSWFRVNEPRMYLYVIPIDAVDGFLSSYLLDVRGRGSAYILLLEAQGAYQSEVLLNAFDFIHTPETRSIISDLTSDGNEEIAISITNPSGEMVVERPRIFSMAEIPVPEIGFQAVPTPIVAGMEFKNLWGVSQEEGQGVVLNFETTMYPTCLVTLQQSYVWNGISFELLETEYTFEPDEETLSYCRFLVDHAAVNWGLEPAIELMEELLPSWPPPLMEDGNPFPEDARDGWLYQLGIYHALVGNFDTATQYLTQVITDPDSLNNPFINQAEQFLASYKTPEDIYKACISVPDCDASFAIDYLINRQELDKNQDLIEYLWQSGVILRSSGYFDFDREGISERWFTAQHRPFEALDFWIIADSPGGKRGLFVSLIEASKPQPTYITEDEVSPLVQTNPGLTFRLQRDPHTSEPYLIFEEPDYTFVNRFDAGVEAARQTLFAGGDVEVVREQLLALQEYPGLLCEKSWSCDPYYYYLGLTNELLGDERAAIENYLDLWWNYSKSCYTTMARLKLKGTIIGPTPTITYTPTPTIAGTPPTTTPTPPGGVQTPTPTETFTGPYPTATEYQTPTPYP